MAYTGEKYVGDLALYYIAKKLESGKTTGTVKEAISKNDINKQLKGDFVGAEPTPGATLGLPYTNHRAEQQYLHKKKLILLYL